jgi:hypothetical protein
MRGFSPLATVACLTILAGVGCSKAQAFKPSGPLPPGTLLFHFTSKVEGPVELVIDGIRIPVSPNKKKVPNMVISGLAPGVHRYFLSSSRDAFGPDHGEVDMPQAQGIFLVNFAQHFDAVLYGKTEPTPTPQGMPGVSARMVP